MNVPFVDFREQYHIIKDELFAGLEEVFEQGSFILGPREKQFEADFAAYCGRKFAIGVNSGTDALYLALSALDITVGDEVIIPTHTFIATALCVSYTGAKPVLVDIEEETFNIDPESFRKAITPKTKAVLPVHIYGQAANMDEINAIAREHNITVIEDACQAHGAEYQGKKTGALGDIGCFSFYPTKSLGAFGDGGMVVTDDEKIAETLLMLRDYGRQGRYEHKVKGYNSRLDTVQAVVLAAKLRHLDEWNAMRFEASKWYAQALDGIEQVRLPKVQPDRTHVFQTYVVRVPDRDRVIEELKSRGIGVLIHYPIPLHLQEAYKDLGHQKGDFPVAEKIADEIISMPMFPHIQKEQVQAAAGALKEILGETVSA